MIKSVSTGDARYPIGHGHGSDAIHRDPIYSYAITQLHDDRGHTGVGLAFTLGEGNQLVCEAARFYAQRLVGKPIEEIMPRFGALQREMADEQQFRWLGPHKGVRDFSFIDADAPTARPPPKTKDGREPCRAGQSRRSVHLFVTGHW